MNFLEYIYHLCKYFLDGQFICSLRFNIILNRLMKILRPNVWIQTIKHPVSKISRNPIDLPATQLLVIIQFFIYALFAFIITIASRLYNDFVAVGSRVKIFYA